MRDQVMRDQDGRIVKRSVTIAGHRTSVSLENVFWQELQAIAAAKNQSLAGIIAEIDAGRGGNLSSALRVFVLETLKSTAPAG